MPILKAKSPIFYSLLDEELFFVGLDKISGVQKIEGKGDSIFITVSASLSKKALRELLGIFQRFKIRKDQISDLFSEKHPELFR
jgi:hypothetical protein